MVLPESEYVRPTFGKAPLVGYWGQAMALGDKGCRLFTTDRPARTCR